MKTVSSGNNIFKLLKNKVKSNDKVRYLYDAILRNLSKQSTTIASYVFYFISTSKLLNLKNPKLFDEKLMWLKIHEDTMIKSELADKYSVREYIKIKGHEEILNELYFVYDKFEEIDYNLFPSSFAIKGTHGSGFNLICPQKSDQDEKVITETCKSWLETDYSVKFAEPHYSRIKPRIIVEKYLGTPEGEYPIDYKIHCFSGEPKFIEAVMGRSSKEVKLIFFNLNWEVLPYNLDSKNFKNDFQKPKTLKRMLEVSRDLSNTFKYVRIDLYEYREKVYFGEMTFTPAACCHTHLFNEAQKLIGKYIELNYRQIS